MRNIWYELKYSLQRMMAGRYGNDALNTVGMILAVVVYVLSVAADIRLLRLLACVLLFVTLSRAYSRHLAQRERENQAFLQFIGRPKRWFALQKRKFADRKSYKYFSCSVCGAVLRVPRGRGKIEITCPKCGTKCIKKS